MFKRRIIRTARFEITKQENKATEAAVTPVIRVVKATRDGSLIRMNVIRDSDGVAINQHHLIVVTDPNGLTHDFIGPGCKVGEFVFPEGFRDGASLSIMEGQYRCEARTCTYVSQLADGSIQGDFLVEHRPFARGSLFIEDA